MKGRKVGNKDSRGKNRIQTVNDDPSETVQSDAHLADINVIMGDFALGGMQALDEADLQFMDVSEFTDLADALNQARRAQLEFMKLPSKVREIFNHDVAVWLDTAHDEDKRDALVEAGYLEPPKEIEKEAPPKDGVPLPPETGDKEVAPEGSKD